MLVCQLKPPPKRGIEVCFNSFTHVPFRYWVLGFNSFSGTLPTSIGALTNISNLALGRQKMTMQLQLCMGRN